MGNHSTKKGLEEATTRVENRVGKITVTGRYHRLPKTINADYEEPAVKQVLGTGYNGEVYMSTSKVGNRKVAVKGFKLHGVSAEKRKELIDEAEIFLGMDHPHIARLVDVYESDDKLNLVMECMSGGELFERVKEQKRFTEKDATNAVYQMLLGINYMHSHGIVHRDIKLENFLYETPGGTHLKLIDFGFSKIWEPNTKMAQSLGTLSYVAPEVLEKNYTSQCDLWSLGVVVFILLFGYMPFSGGEGVQVKNIKAGLYTIKKDIWAKVGEKGQDFVKKLLVVDPSQRLNAEQALNHPWIKDRETANNESVDRDIVNALASFSQASVFRRACMSMMAWSLSNEERAKVRDAFLEMDKNKQGAITLAEFKTVLETKFHISDDQVLKIFSALDTNHTEEIHYSEFLAAMVTTRIAMHDDMLKDTFKRFDVDNSGFITAANLREVLGDHFEGAEVEQLIKEADLAHDGKISYAEWITYLKQGAGGDDEKHAAVAGKIIDKQAINSPDPAKPKAIRHKSEQTAPGADKKGCCVVS